MNNNTFLEAEYQYGAALGSPIRVSELIIYNDSEVGRFFDKTGAMFDFEYHPDSDELYYQYNEQDTYVLNELSAGFLDAMGQVDYPRSDAAGFLYGLSEYMARDDANLKCGSGSQACGGACIPRSSTCRKGKGGAALKQGAKGRKSIGTGKKIGLGLVGAAGLAGAAALAPAYLTKSGRAELRKGGKAAREGSKELADMTEKERSALNLTGEAGDERKKAYGKKKKEVAGKAAKETVASIGRAVGKGWKEVGSNVKKGYLKAKYNLGST